MTIRKALPYRARHATWAPRRAGPHKQRTQRDEHLKTLEHKGKVLQHILALMEALHAVHNHRGDHLTSTTHPVRPSSVASGAAPLPLLRARYLLTEQRELTQANETIQLLLAQLLQ